MMAVPRWKPVKSRVPSGENASTTATSSGGSSASASLPVSMS